MFILITLFYLLFTVFIVYPPTEFVSAGFTIPQLFPSLLGSENVDFFEYHVRRISLNFFIHSLLPFGYFVTLKCGKVDEQWLWTCIFISAFLPVLIGAKLYFWWRDDKKNHFVVRALKPYTHEGGDWKTIASNINTEFRSIDKVLIQLTSVTTLVATQSWLMKIGPYKLNIVKQEDAALVATSADTINMTLTGEDELQYLTLEMVPARGDIPTFRCRVSSIALRDLQPRLAREVRLPDHVTLQPTVVERFQIVFKKTVEQNPVYYTNQEFEPCLGCMQAPADVKLDKLCDSQACIQCNCRVLWCCSCMCRWWISRAQSREVSLWGAGEAPCPLCRATFCVADVRPAVYSRDA